MLHVGNFGRAAFFLTLAAATACGSADRSRKTGADELEPDGGDGGRTSASGGRSAGGARPGGATNGGKSGGIGGAQNAGGATNGGASSAGGALNAGGATNGGAQSAGGATNGGTGGAQSAGGATNGDASVGGTSSGGAPPDSGAGGNTEGGTPDSGTPDARAEAGRDGAVACVPVTAPANLVSRWRGENDLYDEQDRNSGTEAVGVSFVAGIEGMAFHFDYGTPEHVRVPYDPSLDLPTYSIAAWVRTDVQTQYWGTILSKENHATGTPWLDRNYGLFVNKGDVCGAGQVSVTHSLTTACSTTSVNGAWHHVIGTFDGCTLRVYVDGVLEGTTPSAPPAMNSNQELWLGLWAGATTGTDLDEVRLYEGVIDATTIAQLSLLPG